MRHPTHYIERFFYRLGAQVGRRPGTIIIVVLAITGLLSLGLLCFEEANNVRSEYSPLKAPSQREYAVAKSFLKQNGTLDPCYIMTSARDGGSLLRDEYRWLILNMTQALQTEVVVYKELDAAPTDDDDDDSTAEEVPPPLSISRHHPKRQRLSANDSMRKPQKRRRQKAYTFFDMCRPYCELNVAFLIFLRIYNPANPATHTYPSIKFLSQSAFIGNNVYGVSFKENSDPSSPKLLDGFTTAILPFYLVTDYEDTDVMVRWQHAAIRLFERPEYSTLLKTGMTGDNLVSYEVRRMGVETGPLIFGSIALMIVFVVSTSFRVNAIQSKPWEAFVGCLVPLLAMLAAMGLMSALGMRFQSIVVAAIFLVLSVGIDDIFILTRAWHRSPPTMAADERMALTLEDAGPSITISALTNVMSFAIGAASDTPAVRTFCIFSAVAITICYLYQLILLSAVIVLMSRQRERRGYRAVICCRKADLQARFSLVKRGERVHARVVRFWATLMSQWSTRVVLACVMIAYFVISHIGIRRMQSNISIDKMALPDSYLHDFQTSFETALRDMQPISVFVMRPGDLRRSEQMRRVTDLVQAFEHTLNAYGPESTFLWLRDYEEFLRFYNSFDDDGEPESVASGGGKPPALGSATPPFGGADSPRFSYAEIPPFLRSAAYQYWASFMHLNETACQANRPECITAFLFMTNFHDVIKYHELVPTVNDWRRVTAEYADLDVYAYSDHTPFVDQTMSIDQTVFGSVAAALICTALICLIFIPHFLSVVAAVFSVFSISWGIFGLLSLWDVDLDPLSMAALLMAIGFSVDFTAHISYHYYKAPKASPRRRMQMALAIIGWPMVQVGLSTIVALMPLLFKRSYLAMVFLKTIVVVVLLGMFHGLVVLPAVLTLFSPQSGSTSVDAEPKKKRSPSTGSGEDGSGSGSMVESSGMTSSNASSTSSSDCGSERGGSQRSQCKSPTRPAVAPSATKRSQSFYKNGFQTHQLITSFRNREMGGWLGRNRSLFGGGVIPPRLSDANGKPVDANSAAMTVAPLSAAALTGATQKPVTAFVHKIALGRSESSGV